MSTWVTTHTNGWEYIKLICESLIGQSDDDISQCDQAAVIKITSPSGKRSLHCKAHATERFLGVPPELLKDGV